MNWLFYLGIILLPFENFKFAPSAGWAAISPIVLTLYSLTKVRYLKNIFITYWKIFFFITIGILISICNLLFLDKSDAIFAFVRLTDAVETIILGFGCLMAFHVYFIEEKHRLYSVENFIIFSYTIVLIIGIIQIITIRYDIKQIFDFFELISKRNYYFTGGRVQFCFTESSFVGLHLYGILLPIYLIGRNRRIRDLIIAFVVVALIGGCGVRIIVDTLVVIIILIIKELFAKKNWAITLAFTAVVLLPIIFSYFYSNNNRVRQILDEGIYVDNSLASRYFYIQSSLIGASNDYSNFIVGYGIGQEPYVMQKGYEEAFSTFEAGYKTEVQSVEEADKWTTSSGTFCLYTRIAIEYGLIIFTIVLLYLFYIIFATKNINIRVSIIMAMWLYVQFESYAFYSIWLLAVFIQIYRKNQKNAVCEVF